MNQNNFLQVFQVGLIIFAVEANELRINTPKNEAKYICIETVWLQIYNFPKHYVKILTLQQLYAN